MKNKIQNLSTKSEDKILNVRHVKHPFPPVINEESEVLILGSVPSVKSVEGNFYYMHPQNKFWKVLSAIFGVDIYGMNKEERIRELLKRRIAMYDAVEECDIIGSSDSSVKNVIPADIPKLINSSRIGRILCNGATSYKYLSKFYPEYLKIAIKLPSTSPANAGIALTELAEVWRDAFFRSLT